MPDQPKVFVTREIPAAGLDRIREHFDTDVWPDLLPPPRDELLKRSQGCHGLLTLLTDSIDDELFAAAGDQLKVVSNFAVGYNNIDVAAAARRGVQVGNTPDVLTEATADMALALMLAAARRIVPSHEFVRDGDWKTWEPMGHIGVDLKEKTVGIVGMGRIGLATARRLHGGWNMKVLYAGRSTNEVAERELGAVKVSFEELCSQSDFISAHTALTEETKGMFNSAAFQLMKPTAVFVNTARGPIHDQAALAEALQSGELFAAGLDVTDPEPLPTSDPLLSLANCVIAPHIGSATIAARNGMAEIAADNLINGVLGKPLRAEVTA